MKQNYIYKFHPHNKDVEYWFKMQHELHPGMRAVCLGELGNMPRHYIMASQGGNVIYGVHAIDWTEVVEEESLKLFE